MRHHNTLSRNYFEELYAASNDPWNFSASDYERQKYEVTLAVIGSGYRRALEIGCSIGVFTRLLAQRCSQLVAVDIAEGALRQARRCCADQPHVEFRRLALPGAMPSGQFNLVVLSEVGYYWTLSDLDRFAGWLVGALTPRGLCTLVHWTGETDFPLTGDQVHDRILELTRGSLEPRQHFQNQSYRLDVLAKPVGAAA
jgi:SAM-dependent methyltransferase